ncbi:DUF945 family protein [Hydrogenophaga sp. 5NK40-0174]|uniref:DUF945 family protein n=1 Tax=Hydrogenophaga sp. 5NK40-0174 TaxID=3127649 RepID=UPI003103E90E
MKKLLTGVVVVVAGALLILPKVIGSRGAKAYDEAIRQQVAATLPGAVVETEKLDEGWFSSEGRHHIRISEEVLSERMPHVPNDGPGTATDGEVDLIINSKIHHGPIAFSALGSRGGSFLPLAAVSESTFELKSGQDTVEIPGTLFSQVGLGGGSGKAIYVVDKFQKDIKGTLLGLHAVDIEFDIDDDGNAVKAQGEMGTLSLKGAKGDSVQFKDARIEADMNKAHGLWFGTSGMDMEQLSITGPQGQQFSFKDMSFRADVDGNDTAFTAAQVVKVSEVTGPDVALEDFVLEYTFENVDTQAVLRIQKTNTEDPAAVPEAMLNEFKAIVERSPKFNINELSFKMPEGKVAADLHFGLPEQVDMNAFPYSLMQQLQGNGTVRIAEGVMPRLEKLSSGMSAQLEQQGFLAKNGSDYVAELKLQNGQFTVNDKPLR